MLNRLINPVAEQIIGADAGERGENSWRIGPRLAWKARTDIVERRSIQALDGSLVLRPSAIVRL